MTLDFPLTPTKGRPKAHIAVYLRDLNEADVEELKTPVKSNPIAPIQEMKHKHHLLARLVAEGTAYVEVSRITGYTPEYVGRIAREDPAFRELVAYYKSQTELAYLDVHSRLATLGITTIEELQHRMDEHPERFSNREATELMIAALAVGKEQVTSHSAPVAVNISFVTPETGNVIEHEK